uniref:Uncharacterized protein n=1 Tax=Trieres chinensis TaxID=1514140 RepID=A0A7S2A1R7_TRICV|mmetsp:Transcript_37258/g.75922  ORF Transcript_37258/g.75922 Transcript_37258/m.75922 type:complete len:348 (+) Transcript_37258:133-1176(+)|eukprot:CAMPEP_0183293838 /NCGR_PEP_ID=MMETSP0160_2-20130417/2381_1 /TAXON_ID=2839 ORGANISM="Odontella Sinensis, Strain Grunow 1884" /NCGR_SAMPLE_ID=MMETSP0160_2 /ASSEMBLY_ACC=CAM_ASM_000250 /LENGTH=347 /DNA_ID=CAMNT_0025455029 /DNA_START=129 /DNA_END=1172 /DNA_ORIENTATION=+
MDGSILLMRARHNDLWCPRTSGERMAVSSSSLRSTFPSMVSITPASSSTSLASAVASASVVYPRKTKSASELEYISQKVPRKKHSCSVVSIRTDAYCSDWVREEFLQRKERCSLAPTVSLSILRKTTASNSSIVNSQMKNQSQNLSKRDPQDLPRKQPGHWLRLFSTLIISLHIDYVLEQIVSFISTLVKVCPELREWSVIRALLDDHGEVDGIFAPQRRMVWKMVSTASTTNSSRLGNSNNDRTFSISSSSSSVYNEEHFAKLRKDMKAVQSDDILSPAMVKTDGDLDDANDDWGHFAYYEEEDEYQVLNPIGPFRSSGIGLRRRKSMKSMKKLDVVEEGSSDEGF